jgi:hypothetical protein
VGSQNLKQERRAPGVHKCWPLSVAPRVEEHLEHCRPCLGDRADGGESREVYGDRSYAHRANYRVSPCQANHEWSSQRPWKPGHQFDSKKWKPRVMPAFRMHDEHCLTCIEQPACEPDCRNPAPTRRAHASVSPDHGRHSTPRYQHSLIHAANRHPAAVSGLGPCGGSHLH